MLKSEKSAILERLTACLKNFLEPENFGACGVKKKFKNVDFQSLKKLCNCLYSNLLLRNFSILSSLCISLDSTIYYIAIMLQKSFFNILSKASMSLQHFLLCFEGKNILLPNNLPLNDSLSALFLPNHNLFQVYKKYDLPRLMICVTKEQNRL